VIYLEQKEQVWIQEDGVAVAIHSSYYAPCGRRETRAYKLHA